MPRFYFDFHDHGGTTINNDGEEFPSIEAAKKEALAALGDSARDFARRYSEGRVLIRVRDGRSAVLEVSATFEARPVKVEGPVR
jgi:hypothetical protein